MNIKKAITALFDYMKGLRENSEHDQYEFADLISMERSRYSKFEKYGTDMKMSVFLTICRKHKQQPWVVLRFALEHGFDFTEPDSKEWGE
jgi:hypothetical protein